MAPSSPKPVEIAEDVGPGDVANYGLALDGDQQAEFEVEEEQVLQGLALLFTDKMEESEQFFEELKAGNARLTLHHAQVAALKALMGFKQEDIDRAINLLGEAYTLASQTEKQKRTHSKVAKVKGFFQWATGQRGRAGSEAEARMEGTEKAGDTAARLQRQRRQRLRALTVQAEADLLVGLLYLVGSGELATHAITAGFYIRRAWSEYGHCQSKLEQVLRDYAVMKGLQAGPDMDDERLAGTERDIGGEWSDEEGEATPGKKAAGKASAAVVPIEDRPEAGDGEKPAGEDDFGDFAAAPAGAYEMSAGLARLDLKAGGAVGANEDPELVSLRAGIQFGVGMLHAVMSMLPPAVLRSLEWVGVAGIERKQGLHLLQQCATTHTAHATLAAYAQLHYRSVIMGYLPRSETHSGAAAATLAQLAAPFRESTLFSMAQVRTLRYSGQLAAAAALAQQEPRRAPIECLHLRRHRLHEQAWCTLLRGDMEAAAPMFDSLVKATKSGYRKTFYTAFQIACLWESGPRHYAAAAGLLRDSAPMMKATSTPLEAYIINMATHYNATDSRPLFPARELLAYWNGFQAMDVAALEAHIRVVEEALHTRCQDVGGSQDDGQVEEAVVSGILAAANGRPTASAAAAGGQDKARFGHAWTERSKMLCRFLLGVLQRHAGQTQRAEDGLKYVVAAGNVEQLPNILPYAAYELGSLLMAQPTTAGEGIKLLEKAVAYPPHDFQSRLKFVVSERVAAYFERKE